VASPRAILLLCATLSLGASQVFAIPIRDLHKNNSSILPNHLGQRFDVTGIITSPDSVRSKVNSEVWIQDTTGGINLFQSNGIGNGVGQFHFNLGDSVSIQGTVSHFNGLAELTSLTNYTFHSAGNFGAIEPLVLTCLQVNQTLLVSTPDSFPEYNESKMIRINNVSRVGGAVWPTTCTGNSTIQISDGTATCLLFIDVDSEVCGSSDPGGPFDVIGVLSQFDNAAPYNTGYEIVPRYKTDIITHTPGPSFLTNPTAVDIESTSVSIEWTTDTQSTSLVEYGLTTAYGSAAGDSTPVTSHSVPLTGLTPGKLYHFHAASTDGAGTRVSADFAFVTPSSSPGQMHFFFNKSIDPSLAYTDTAQGNANLLTPVLNRVNSAQYDISLAVYSFNIVALADALIAAKNRGVKVRMVLDAESGQTQADRLRAAAIPVITSTYGGNHASGGIHHNKFFTIDSRDTTTTLDDWIWTGSVNMSNENMQDANNGFEIQDYGLAQAYLAEFNEEWGSSTDTPNAANSKIGNRKTDNTPHHFVVNGIPIDLYFSPSDGTENQIVNAVNTANYGVFFSIYTFTSNPIANAIHAKWTGVPGFMVRGVFDASGANNTGSEWPDMSGSGGSPWVPLPDVWLDNVGPGLLLHHKYGIVDEGHADSDPLVITGSHNWSNAANTVNDENTLIFHDLTIANLYLQEFAARYQEAGGSAELRAVGVGDRPALAGLALSAPWPSPAGGASSVEFTVPGGVTSGQRTRLALYDLGGRLMRTIVDEAAVPGTRRVSFPATDRTGSRLAAGVYFLKLDAMGSSLHQKWVLVR
jgi:phosphatidylserine/phosphatidylglycerophosphate/cardiolipin synthase-like enzyme